MRSIRSGTISFGLVSVPVRMFTATESKELRFHFLHKRDLTPIGYDRVRKDTGEHVEPDEIVRGFEFEKGRYVELSDEDLDRLDVELTHSIDICDFVALEEIDPIYFRKAYYLLPGAGAEKPYRLLGQALEETGKVGIAARAHPRQGEGPAAARTRGGGRGRGRGPDGGAARVGGAHAPEPQALAAAREGELASHRDPVVRPPS